jgi:cAMP-binding proteins - catabolite gene activator and regulatory subunit of cAMP-dependent protein kinases
MMKTILVIEDNKDVRENVAEILSLANYKVFTAQDGRTGVEQAINHQPDLIVCDIMMPQMDGFGVIRILSKRTETADIPFIFLTAKTERGDFRRAMNLGADDYITKPFDDVELLDAIELRLEKSQRLRHSFDGSETGLGHFMKEAKAYAALEELSKDREGRHYRKKDLIYEEGTYPYQLYFIAKGKVKIFKTNNFGKELIVNIYKEGEFLGYIPLIQNAVHTESAEALEDCEMRLIPKEDFLSLLHKNTNVAAQLIKMLANNITEKESQLLNMAYNSVRKRVAEALLQLFDRYESAGKAEITLLREDLASMTGTAKETVIRTLAEFKSDSLLDIKGGRIIVSDRKLLEDLPY